MLALAAGCGGEEAPSSEAVATVDVSETEYALDPSDATVDESGVIEFVASNDGEIEHSLEVEGPEEAATDTISPGDSASVEVDLPPGEYKWYCPIGDHEQQGMVGTVTVGGASASGSETETETESEGGSSPY